MMAFTHHASWGLSLDKDSNMNYQFSLPNKIFDYIHALTPIICTDLVEIRNIVAKHEVGAFIANHNPVQLAHRINELVNNKQLHTTFVANCKQASEVLCWENEIRILNQIYTFHD
jgi:glycosyltransferase involved in cell wall biosynthesis